MTDFRTIHGEAVGIWQHREPSGNHASALQLTQCPLDTVPLLRWNVSYQFFKTFWWGLINSCLHSVHGTHMTVTPIHAPRFLMGWHGLLSQDSHFSVDSFFLLIPTYSPSKSLCPKGLWQGRWVSVVRKQNREGGEEKWKRKCVPSRIFLRIPKQRFSFFELDLN